MRGLGPRGLLLAALVAWLLSWSIIVLNRENNCLVTDLIILVVFLGLHGLSHALVRIVICRQDSRLFKETMAHEVQYLQQHSSKTHYQLGYRRDGHPTQGFFFSLYLGLVLGCRSAVFPISKFGSWSHLSSNVRLHFLPFWAILFCHHTSGSTAKDNQLKMSFFRSLI